MRKELETRAAEAVAIAKKAGAQDAWAGADRSREVSFEVRQGVLENVKDATSRSLGIRLYVDGRYSAHSTTDLRPEKLKGFIREAIALTRALEPDEHRSIPDAALFSGRPDAATLDLVDNGLSNVAREQRIKRCNEMNVRLVGKPKVISATSGFSDTHSIVAAASSNGFRGSYASTMAAMWSEVSLDDGEKRPEDWMGAWGHHLGELPAPGAIADRALELANARLGQKKGPTKRTTMVVDPRSAGRLVGRLLGPARASSVQQERSFWKGKLGQKLVSDKLSVYDDPTVRRGLGSRPFDNEGIAAKRMPLIEAGVAKNLYVDTYYGKKLGIAPTTGSSSNRVLALGTRSRDEILAATKDGIYVTSWLGGNMDSTTGDFSFGVAGRLIENGVLTSPVGEMNVTGNIVSLWSELTELGNDPWIYSSTLAPTLVFDGVQFSGA